MAMKPEISVKNLLMQAFLTGWERSDKSISHRMGSRLTVCWKM